MLNHTPKTNGIRILIHQGQNLTSTLSPKEQSCTISEQVELELQSNFFLKHLKHSNSN